MASAADIKNSEDVTFWGPVPPVLKLSSQKEFADLQTSLHQEILSIIRLYHYNTLFSFAKFHQQYRQAQSDLLLETFNKSLPVTYDSKSLSCIGLSLTLRTRTLKSLPGLEKYLYFGIGNEYPLSTPEPEGERIQKSEIAKYKEHVFLALEFSLNDRRGFMLLDVGLGLDHPVIVMKDGLFPHTGSFKQISRMGYREYNLEMANNSSTHIIWNITEHRGEGVLVQRHRFLYLGRKTKGTDELERRNRVYRYHAHALMCPGGFEAGLYIVIGKDRRRFTVFVNDDSGEVLSGQFPYEYFLPSFNQSDVDFKVTDESERLLEKFATLCGFEGLQELKQKLIPVSEACCDESFIEQVLDLDTKYQSLLEASIST